MARKRKKKSTPAMSRNARYKECKRKCKMEKKFRDNPRRRRPKMNKWLRVKAVRIRRTKKGPVIDFKR